MPSNHPSDLWFYGYIPYKMAFGILSILVPLFIIGELGGGLVEVGIVISAFNLLTIPSSILFGHLSDRRGGRRGFIVFSFALTSATIFLFSFVRNVWEFLLLYIAQSIVFAAHQPATNMLIVESNPQNLWDKKIGLQQMVAGVGWTAGLVLGALWMVAGALRDLIPITGLLCAATALMSAVLIKNPPHSLERAGVKVKGVGPNVVERATFKVHHTHHNPHPKGLGKRLRGGLRSNLAKYDLAVLTFSIAGTMVFTPLPIFFKSEVGLAETAVFWIFVLNSAASAIAYPLAGRWGEKNGDRTAVALASGLRIGFFPLLFIGALVSPDLTVTWVSASILLSLIGVSWALFAVPSTSLSMELVPPADKGESTGIYAASIGLGGVVGAFLGGAIPAWFTSPWGYGVSFGLAGLLCALSLTLFLKVKPARTNPH